MLTFLFIILLPLRLLLHLNLLRFLYLVMPLLYVELFVKLLYLSLKSYENQYVLWDSFHHFIPSSKWRNSTSDSQVWHRYKTWSDLLVQIQHSYSTCPVLSSSFVSIDRLSPISWISPSTISIPLLVLGWFLQVSNNYINIINIYISLIFCMVMCRFF